MKKILLIMGLAISTFASAQMYGNYDCRITYKVKDDPYGSPDTTDYYDSVLVAVPIANRKQIERMVVLGEWAWIKNECDKDFACDWSAAWCMTYTAKCKLIKRNTIDF